MNRRQPTAACMAALLLATASAGALADGSGQARVLRAHAVVTGAPGTGIEGIVTFSQLQSCPDCPAPKFGLTPSTDPAFRNFPEPPVVVVARINGAPTSLTPGAHGMHVHEVANCGDTATAAHGMAGGHFDPGPFASSTPVDANHPFHMGDLPNLIVDNEGRGFMKTTTSRITLSPGPLSIFDDNGSAVIVHVNSDTGQTGINGGAGGARIACGIVVPTLHGEHGEDDD